MKRNWVPILISSMTLFLITDLNAILVMAGTENGEYDASANLKYLNRTPSMSRANSWSTSQFNLPSSMTMGSNQSQNNSSTDQIQQFLNQHNQVSQVSVNNPQKRFQGESQIGNNLRNQVIQQYPNRNQWFNSGFWSNYNYTPPYWSNGFNSWNYGNWGNVNGWLSGGWGNPYYYNESNIDPETESIYQQNLPAGSPQTQSYIYDPTTNIDPSTESIYNQNLPAAQDPPQSNYTSSSNINPETAEISQTNQNQASDWMSLGVFALTKGQETSPTMFFQLALNKNGTISGTYYNQTTNQIYPIEGKVDKSTQRAAWKISSGGNSPIFTAGIYNLTLPQTPVKVYFGSQTQNWFLVHLK